MSFSGNARRVFALLGLSLLAGCSEQSVVAELRSLSGSEDVVLVCRDDRGVGHPYSDCPDRTTTDDTDAAKHLSVYALVSQTVTDEVAVIDVSGGHVVDVDASTPGYGFLRVGGRPVSMAATPGGNATFVATADVGRNGIFALPTSCLGAPAAGMPQLDLTSWAACRLDETPGEMAVMVEPVPAEGASVPAELAGCSKPYDDDDAPTPRTVQVDVDGQSTEAAICPADLRTEGGPAGRRKLVVALPDSGRLAVIDAQSLLRLPPGEFPSCTPLIDRYVDLKVEVPAGVSQTLPADLSASTCAEAMAPTAPPPPKRSPQPAGFAVADDRLYVADQTAPVIHVLDAQSVCGLTELPSLLPMSLREPWRVVTTRRVAVSPLTPAGKRFAYAIDAEDQPGASVMVFDVSPNSTDPTPIVRAGSPELLGEKPDRLSLGASAKDVAFAYRDIPYVDPKTGAAQFGVRCDPDPSAALDSPGALARTSSDFLTGARPGLLRGLFGFILMSNGTIGIVDEDDLDADCRRPVQGNTSDSGIDVRGCGPSDLTDSFKLAGSQGQPTVSGETSCRVVEPHRFRGSRFVVNNSTLGAHAPSLRSLPQLTLPTSAPRSAVEDRPRLLAVPFDAGTPADIYVGSALYSTDPQSEAATGATQAPVDPNSRDSSALSLGNAVVLPPLEPRSYPADDTVTLTYEGSYAGERTAGFLAPDDESKPTQFTLSDGSLSFCAVGVYDQATMQDYAAQELGLGTAEAKAFASMHADYVQLTTPLLASDDAYWGDLARAYDARKDREPDLEAPPTYDQCLEWFGAHDADPLLASRDLSITRATVGALVVEQRVPSATGSLQHVHQCFPQAQQYRLRAGAHWILLHAAFGFRHDVIADANGACVRSCSPLKKWDKGRVFEISSVAESTRESAPANTPACRDVAVGEMAALVDPLALRVGCATPDEVACVYDQTNPGSGAQGSSVALGTPAAACIFNGLNDRFALYRGRAPSVRDATFTWQVTGGFTPEVMSLTSLSSVVSPQSLLYLPDPEELAIVDGSSQGLSLFSLDTFGVVKPSPFY